MEFLADIGFVESVWRESLDNTVGDARRFAEAHSRSTFAISIPTSIRLLAASGADEEEIVSRFIKAFPVIDFNEKLIAKAAALFRTHDLSMETAIEGAIAKENNLKILTDSPSRYKALPGIEVVNFRDSSED